MSGRLPIYTVSGVRPSTRLHSLWCQAIYPSTQSLVSGHLPVYTVSGVRPSTRLHSPRCQAVYPSTQSRCQAVYPSAQSRCQAVYPSTQSLVSGRLPVYTVSGVRPSTRLHSLGVRPSTRLHSLWCQAVYPSAQSRCQTVYPSSLHSLRCQAVALTVGSVLRGTILNGVIFMTAIMKKKKRHNLGLSHVGPILPLVPWPPGIRPSTRLHRLSLVSTICLWLRLSTRLPLTSVRLPPSTPGGRA